ncbi:MAG: hypothetical protein AAFX93_06430 [Verrucomicrobiota bacterium]
MSSEPTETAQPSEPEKAKVAFKDRDHLSYVAWAFYFIGGMALLQTIHNLFYSPLPVPNFLMAFLAVGWGLKRRISLWRSAALSCSYVMVVFYGGNLLVVLFGNKALPTMSIVDVVLFWGINFFTVIINGYAIWALQLKSVRNQFK